VRIEHSIGSLIGKIKSGDGKLWKLGRRLIESLIGGEGNNWQDQWTATSEGLLIVVDYRSGLKTNKQNLKKLGQAQSIYEGSWNYLGKETIASSQKLIV